MNTALTHDLGDVRVTLSHHTMGKVPVVHEVHVGKAIGRRNRWYVNGSFHVARTHKELKLIRQCSARTKREMRTAVAQLRKALRP